MQIIKSFVKIAIFVLPLSTFAQHTFLPKDAKEYTFLDRQEILQQNNPTLNLSAVKPFSRETIMQIFSNADSSKFADKWNKYSWDGLQMNNSEWQQNNAIVFQSKKPILKKFYTTPCNFYEVNNKDFFLAINPILQIKGGMASGETNEKLFLNARGITLRGRIANKVGFSSTIIETQERGPSFYQQFVNTNRAVPGNGFYKVYKKDLTAQDYFDGRGYFTFSATKYIDFQLGYDKNFIGNGYRSLFLSDWGNSYLFGKINTKIWKFNYQNLFMELTPQFSKTGDTLLPKKYAAMHHLSMNVTRWLNIGLFEGVMFGRRNHFDFQYINPVIFYRHIEGTVGSPDNAVAGIDFKANVRHRFQFYGQFLLDEFILSKIKNDPSFWANKFAIQIGGKYINAFGVKNLDLQMELNRVRPFTYSHNDTINNYAHYNQPLAHPLGANFQECIGIVRYHPLPKWNMYARGIYYFKGLDSGNANFGGNIFKSYLTRLKGDGFTVGAGDKLTCFNGQINVSYEWKQNLFLETGLQYRSYKLQSEGVQKTTTTFNVGLRLNMYERAYDF